MGGINIKRNLLIFCLTNFNITQKKNTCNGVNKVKSIMDQNINKSKSNRKIRILRMTNTNHVRLIDKLTMMIKSKMENKATIKKKMKKAMMKMMKISLRRQCQFRRMIIKK